MNDHLGKDHTPAYIYLKAVADRLHSTWAKVEALNGRNSDVVRDAVARKCCRDFDESVVNALNANYPADDIRAAVSRIKDGKNWLKFLDAVSAQIAA